MGCRVSIQKKLDLTGIEVQYLGTIKLDDVGFTTKCDEEIALKKMSSETCFLDGNLINIVDEAYPLERGYSTCYRCVADIYRIAQNPTYARILQKREREILKYSSQGFITQENITGSAPENAAHKFNILPRINIAAYDYSILTGKPKEFKAEAWWYSDVSWVKPGLLNEMMIQHLNGYFDIAQIHAKFIENDVLKLKPMQRKYEIIQQIIDLHLQDYDTMISRYKVETESGENQMEQENWNKELSRLKDGLFISTTKD
ncbi:MAG: hypothetical protein Salg2KO_12750 [Salibacteraceae bacterium]